MDRIMPENPTPEMKKAALDAMTNATVSDPKAAAWDAIVAYRAMQKVAPMLETESEGRSDG